MTDLRITQAEAEVLRAGTPKLRITQASAEVLRIGEQPDLRITQASIEVLRSISTTENQGNFFLLF